MRLLVTGATGFIGGAIARSLRSQGHEVHALVRDATRLGASVQDLRPVSGELVEEGGLDGAKKVAETADAVIHAAAVRKSWGIPDEELARANVEGTRRLVGVSQGAGRFIHVSSVAVYGHPRTTPVEERAPFSPATRYGWAKLQAEEAVAEEARKVKLPLTIVRPVITYGPGDTYGMIPQLLRLVKARRYLMVGDGRNRVHLAHINDLVDGVCLALRKPEAAGEDFILCGPEPITMKRLVGLASEAMARWVPPLGVPEGPARALAACMEAIWKRTGRQGEPIVTRGKIDIVCRDRAFSSAKAQRLLGYQPRWDYEQGIPDAARWLEEQGLV